MFATKNFVLFFIVFIVAVNARPLRSHIHKRRATACVAVSSPSITKATSSDQGLFSLQNTKTEKSPSAHAAAPTTKDTSSLTGLLAKLFPVSKQLSQWTTASASPNSLPLSDSTFRAIKILSAAPYSYKNAPDGTQSIQVHYPQGSYTFDHVPVGGISFYAPGPSSVDLTTAKEATFGYSVYFPSGFAFQKGGKLPGLYGGDSPSESVTCSGGSRSSACFSVRLMWRTSGAGEMYTYLPPVDANQAICDIKPFSTCNPTFGASVGRGSFTFATGAWTTVSERVRLNDVGQANGEIELFVNGVSVIQADGLELRTSGDGRIRGIQMQSFFGGSSEDFASPKTQDAYFSNFAMAITQSL